MQTTYAIRTFVLFLRDRYGCVLRAWHAVLDTYCRGRIQKSAFVATCHWLGFASDAQRLWASLRPDGSPLRLYHLSEEEAVNIELFVLSVGRNLDRAWATLDLRNLGVVSLAQFQRFADTLDFKGDAKLLFSGLDSSGVGRLRREDFMTCLSVHSLAILKDFNSHTRTESLRKILTKLSVVAASQSGRAVWAVVKSGIGAKAQEDSALGNKEEKEAPVSPRSKRSPSMGNVPIHCEEEPLLKQRTNIKDVPTWQNPLLKRNANIKCKSFLCDAKTEQGSKRSESVPTVLSRGDNESTPAPLLKHIASANRVCTNDVDDAWDGDAKLPTHSTRSPKVEDILRSACNRSGSVDDSLEASLLDMTPIAMGRETGAVGDRRRRLSPGVLGLKDVSTKEFCHRPTAESPTDTGKLRGTPTSRSSHPWLHHRADSINAEGRAQVPRRKWMIRKTSSLGKALRSIAPMRVGEQRMSPLSFHGDMQRQSGSELTLEDSERLPHCSVLPGLRRKCAASLANERIDLDELVKDAFLSPKSRAHGAGATPVRVIRIEHLDQLGIGCRPWVRGSDNAVAVDNSLEGESWRGDDASGLGSTNCTDMEAPEGDMAFSASLEVGNVAVSPTKLVDGDGDLECLDGMVHIKVLPVEVDDMFIRINSQRGINSLGLPPGGDNNAPATPTQAAGESWRGDDACGVGTTNCTDMEALEGDMAFSASLEVGNVAVSPTKSVDGDCDLECLDRVVHIKVVPVEVDDMFIRIHSQRRINSLGLPPGGDNNALATPTQAAGDARIELDRPLQSFLASDCLVPFGNGGNSVKEDTQFADGVVNVAELALVNAKEIESSREVEPEPEACDDEKSQLQIEAPSILGQQIEREEAIALVPEVMPAKIKKTVRVRTSISEVQTFRRGTLEHLHSFTEGWWRQHGESVDNSSDESDSEKSENEFF